MIVKLKNENSNIIKEAKVGFSWTTLLFGIFVPLIRGDIKWFLIMFIVAVVTAGLSWLVFPFFYNSTYIKGLLENGYIPVSDSDRQVLMQRGIASFN